MTYRDVLKRVDHTLLKQPSTWEQIREICDDAVKFGTASVCIPPSFVKQASEYLGEKMPIGLLPYIQATLLARYLRGEIDDYPAFLMT